MIPRIITMKKAFIIKLTNPLPVFEYDANVVIIQINIDKKMINPMEYIMVDLFRKFFKPSGIWAGSSRLYTKKINPNTRIRIINVIIFPVFILRFVPNKSL
jgi:hypothetical protein